MGDPQQPGTISRRNVLKGGVVGAGLVWASPVMSSMPAWAAHEGPFVVEFRIAQEAAVGPTACNNWTGPFNEQDLLIAGTDCRVTSAAGVFTDVTLQNCNLGVHEAVRQVEIHLGSNSYNSGWRIREANGIDRRHNDQSASCTWSQIFDPEGGLMAEEVGGLAQTDPGEGGQFARFTREADNDNPNNPRRLRRVRIMVEHIDS